jgi:hypothetical protein
MHPLPKVATAIKVWQSGARKSMEPNVERQRGKRADHGTWS